jgi:hypothetical protein
MTGHETNNDKETTMQDSEKLLAALKSMRKAYGTFYRGNCYITAAYEAELAEANRIADDAILAAEQKMGLAASEAVVSGCE